MKQRSNLGAYSIKNGTNSDRHPPAVRRRACGCRRADQQYLAEDARRVVQPLRRRGIDTFAFGISNGPFSQLDRIFGERRALRVPRIEVLPQRLVQLYRELKK